MRPLPQNKRKKRRNTVFSLTKAFLGRVSCTLGRTETFMWKTKPKLNKNPLGSGSESLFMKWTWSRQEAFSEARVHLSKGCSLCEVLCMVDVSGVCRVRLSWGQILALTLVSTSVAFTVLHCPRVYTGTLSAHPHGYFANYIRLMWGNHDNWLTHRS